MLGPWAVSGPAIAVGEPALADAAWAAAARLSLVRAAARLDQLLMDAQLEVVGGTSLFRLVQTGNAANLFDRLGRAGILVRRFSERPTWLRFGLPGVEAEWQRLTTALGATAGCSEQTKKAYFGG
jgi:cobalamin biosynthetic protein CobC